MDKPYELPPMSEIDSGMRDLIIRINDCPLFCTWSSCEGHQDNAIFDKPLIGIAVRGLDGVQHLVDWLNRAQELDDAVQIDCDLNFSRDVYASTDFTDVPDWITFEITVQRFDGKRSTADDLKSLSTALEFDAKERP